MCQGFINLLVLTWLHCGTGRGHSQCLKASPPPRGLTKKVGRHPDPSSFWEPGTSFNPGTSVRAGGRRSPLTSTWMQLSGSQQLLPLNLKPAGLFLGSVLALKSVVGVCLCVSMRVKAFSPQVFTSNFYTRNGSLGSLLLRPDPQSLGYK